MNVFNEAQNGKWKWKFQCNWVPVLYFQKIAACEVVSSDNWVIATREKVISLLRPAFRSPTRVLRLWLCPFPSRIVYSHPLWKRRGVALHRISEHYYKNFEDDSFAAPLYYPKASSTGKKCRQKSPYYQKRNYPSIHSSKCHSIILYKLFFRSERQAMRVRVRNVLAVKRRFPNTFRGGAERAHTRGALYICMTSLLIFLKLWINFRSCLPNLNHDT